MLYQYQTIFKGGIIVLGILNTLVSGLLIYRTDFQHSGFYTPQTWCEGYIGINLSMYKSGGTIFPIPLGAL